MFLLLCSSFHCTVSAVTLCTCHPSFPFNRPNLSPHTPGPASCSGSQRPIWWHWSQASAETNGAAQEATQVAEEAVCCKFWGASICLSVCSCVHTYIHMYVCSIYVVVPSHTAHNRSTSSSKCIRTYMFDGSYVCTVLVIYLCTYV